MSVAETDPEHMVDLKVPVDVTVLDADSIPIKSDAAPALKMNVIALIGTEDPEPAEMAARSPTRIISHQATTIGGTLHGVGGRIRLRAAT
jgi:hypothetical protein